MHHPLILLVGAGLVVSIAGCGGSSKENQGSTNALSTVVVTKTVSVSATGTPTDTPPPASDPTPTDPTDDASAPTPTDGSDGSSSGPPIIHQAGADRVLTASDAFSSEEWEEGSYTAGGTATPVQGIRTGAHCGYKSQPLEYRFGQSTGTLHVTVAQDNTSRSATSTQKYDLIVDGRTVQSKNVTFKQTAELTTNLSGVADVQIVVQGADDQSSQCDSTIALITKVQITAE